MAESPQPPDGGFQTEWPQEPAATPPKRHSPLAFFRELPVLIVIAFGLAILMKTFLIQAFYIPSESMEPTLHGCQGCQGDRVLVNKLVFRFREPRRGDVIVFIAHRGEEEKTFLGKVKSFLFEGLGVVTPTDQDFIKRVIGEPGDKIEVNENGVFITPANGKRFKLSEPYIKRTRDPIQNDARTCGSAKECEQGPHGVFPSGTTRVPKDMYFVMGDNRGNSSDSRSSLGPVKRSDIVGKAFVKIWPVKRWDTITAPDYCSDPRVRCEGERAFGLLPIGALTAGALRVRRRGRTRSNDPSGSRAA